MALFIASRRDRQIQRDRVLQRTEAFPSALLLLISGRGGN